MLKAWKSPAAPVFRVIVAEEDECEKDQPEQGGEELAQKQTHELQAVLLMMLNVRQQARQMIMTIGLILGRTHPLDQFRIGWPQHRRNNFVLKCFISLSTRRC